MYKNAFFRAEQQLREKGFFVFNPARCEIENGEWEDYMKFDLKNLLTCDAIFLLRGWKASRGAKLEYDLAKVLKMEIIEDKKDERLKGQNNG